MVMLKRFEVENFKGFDELCLNYYKQFLPKDPLIDSFLEKSPKLDFSTNFLFNKKELLLC